MKFFFLFPLLIVGALLAAQPVCTITDSLYRVLDGQAGQIIFNEMVSARTAAASPIALDSVKRAEYLALLFAVHQLTGSPERDTVIDQLDIQPFPFVSATFIELYADTSLNWMMNIRAGNPSGNSALDSMNALYDVSITGYNDFFFLNSHRVELTCAGPMNTVALAAAYKAAMPDLNFASPDQLIGDGDNIEMIPLIPEGYIVRYSVGSGDCPAGCINRKNYDFDVEPVCTEFDIQQSGGTATRRSAIAPLIVYPTPFTGEIHLPETIVRYSFELFDAVGRRVKFSATEQSGSVTGLHDLVPGWYVLRVRDQTGKTYLARVIK